MPVGVDCHSPTRHSLFADEDQLLDAVERIAEATGLPVGIKAAVGELGFWRRLADLMAAGDRGVDFITIDGGEGGTGAAPLVFADHVALLYAQAHASVFRIFAERGLQRDVVFIGSGKLGFPDTALLAFGMGADMVNVGREAMMAIGCIQAQRCHTDRCPTGVATQSAWLQHGLDPALKSVRLAGYVSALRAELLRLSRACGHPHPAFLTPDRFEFLTGGRLQSAADRFDLAAEWSVPRPGDLEAITPLTPGS